MPPKYVGCIYSSILFTLGILSLTTTGYVLAAQPISVTLQTSNLEPPLPIAPPSSLTAQIPPEINPDTLPQILPGTLPPSIAPPQPQQPPIPLPPPDQLLQPIAPVAPTQETPNQELEVLVQRFDVQGSTIFAAEDLEALAWQAALSPPDSDFEVPLAAYCPDAIAPTSEDPDATAAESSEPPDIPSEPIEWQPPQQPQELTFEQLLRARSAITNLYIGCRYITSGAILPPQTPDDQSNTVIIQVVEGGVEDINVVGTERLNSSYVRSRLAIATDPPLNQRELLEALQLLQLDPLIYRISAELQAGTRPSSNILEVTVTEADSFNTELALNNNRSPSVGSFERGISVNQANLLGFGDSLTVGYTNTDGSDGINTSYRIPINPRNGTIAFSYSYTHSNVIEPPFDVLDISSDSFYYDLTARQPLYQTPNTEFALGLSLSRQESQTRIGFDDIGPFPLSPGADDEGRTRVTALRFTQEWIDRSPRQVLAARSQFSLGLDFLDSTVNEEAPDSRFFAWRGQGQWVRQLDTAGTLLLARTDVQLTGDALVPLERFGLGGQDTVRGYRQDVLLTDNGILSSLELQYPIVRSPQIGGQLYLVPSINAGMGWNVSSPDPDPQTIVGTGLGLLWRQDDGDLSARLDFGIPLVSIEDAGERTWQESGVYFSIVYSPF